jgi:hypothetical protein
MNTPCPAWRAFYPIHDPCCCQCSFHGPSDFYVLGAVGRLTISPQPLPWCVPGQTVHQKIDFDNIHQVVEPEHETYLVTSASTNRIDFGEQLGNGQNLCVRG